MSEGEVSRGKMYVPPHTYTHTYTQNIMCAMLTLKYKCISVEKRNVCWVALTFEVQSSKLSY